MLKITLTQDDAAPQPIFTHLKSMAAAKLQLEHIRKSWALDNVPLHYDGTALYVGSNIIYRIEKE